MVLIAGCALGTALAIADWSDGASAMATTNGTGMIRRRKASLFSGCCGTKLADIEGDQAMMGNNIELAIHINPTWEMTN